MYYARACTDILFKFSLGTQVHMIFINMYIHTHTYSYNVIHIYHLKISKITDKVEEINEKHSLIFYKSLLITLQKFLNSLDFFFFLGGILDRGNSRALHPSI
jgi:hypothetical protein